MAPGLGSSQYRIMTWRSAAGLLEAARSAIATVRQYLPLCWQCVGTIDSSNCAAIHLTSRPMAVIRTKPVIRRTVDAMHGQVDMSLIRRMKGIHKGSMLSAAKDMNTSRLKENYVIIARFGEAKKASVDCFFSVDMIKILGNLNTGLHHSDGSLIDYNAKLRDMRTDIHTNERRRGSVG